jgi:SNF2 family DNA or RNA helicase
LLRRTKREVYKELPEKLEQVVYCSLTAQQSEVYQKLLAESRRQVSELAGAKDQNKGRMLMLTALLRLRQACCDLRLLGIQEVSQEQASAKLELLDELLREAMDGGHRVLIFSQFVAMLQIQKRALEAAEIPYCYLDGQTKDRMRVVDRFQNDASVPVFLISLKAGGVGLNLTGADTVVHFDPWWNPAVEAQATDRAHRIGQEKVVTAYKLITRGTVEEKILKLQETKRGLMESIESEEPVMSGLSTAEIQELLA